WPLPNCWPGFTRWKNEPSIRQWGRKRAPFWKRLRPPRPANNSPQPRMGACIRASAVLNRKIENPARPIRLNRHAGDFLVRLNQPVAHLQRGLERNARLLHVDHDVVQRHARFTHLKGLGLRISSVL